MRSFVDRWQHLKLVFVPSDQQRAEALTAHATQIDPAGAFLASPVEDQQDVWPTEEFELAASRVETTLPETDLFAGIEEES